MYTFITLLVVLVSILLILLVLIQKPKGGGLAQGFSSTNQIMGVKRTADVVERGTWILSLSLLTLALLINLWIPRGEDVEAGAATRLEEKVLEAPATPAPSATPGAVAPAGSQSAAPQTGDSAQ